MTDANRGSAEYWNGLGGERWLAREDGHAVALGPYVAPLLDAAQLEDGHRVLDIGCGTGPTSVAAAGRVGSSGQVLGADISKTILDAARATVDAPNVTFVEADGQTADLAALGGGPFDRAISRFGVMFFEDPAAAFANIRAALVAPGGRLAFIAWRGIEDNDWMRVPGEALAAALDVDFVAPAAGPGPYGLSDGDRVQSILGEAGFGDVSLERFDVTMEVGGGRSAEDAARFVVDAVQQFLPEGGAEVPDRDQAEGWVADALRPYEDERGVVVMPTSTWIVTASA